MRNDYDRHIFLYAKGHYEVTDQINDLRKILGERSGIEWEYITIDDILRVLLNLIWNYINNRYQFVELLLDLSPHNTWKYGYVYREALVSKCLSILRFQKVIDIPFKLGEVDEKILPMNKFLKEKKKDK